METAALIARQWRYVSPALLRLEMTRSQGRPEIKLRHTHTHEVMWLFFTWIEVVGLGHFHPRSRVFLKLGDGLATLADDCTGRHPGHQNLEVVRAISSWKIKTVFH